MDFYNLDIGLVKISLPFLFVYFVCCERLNFKSELLICFSKKIIKNQLFKLNGYF